MEATRGRSCKSLNFQIPSLYNNQQTTQRWRAALTYSTYSTEKKGYFFCFFVSISKCLISRVIFSKCSFARISSHDPKIVIPSKVQSSDLIIVAVRGGGLRDKLDLIHVSLGGILYSAV